VTDSLAAIFVALNYEK